jgi:carbon-monoxide dehydrogenase small subunit
MVWLPNGDILVTERPGRLRRVRDNRLASGSIAGVPKVFDSGQGGLLDNKPVASCLVLAVEAQDKKIETIEGVATDDNLHPLQQSFLDYGAFQCGFCTPGMLMTAKGFLVENPHPTEAEIRHAIAGNLCRCTGYNKYVEAILDTADKIED